MLIYWGLFYGANKICPYGLPQLYKSSAYVAITRFLTPEGNFILFNFDVDKFTLASMAIKGLSRFIFTLSKISAATLRANSFPTSCEQ